jgi:hypothetical protein
MKFKHKNKVFVTGPSASGTTALTWFLHVAGIDGGFSEKEMRELQDSPKGKALEVIMSKGSREHISQSRANGYDDSPKLIKRPWSVTADLVKVVTLWDILEEFDGWGLEHVVVVLRSFEDFYLSAVGHENRHRGGPRSKFADRKETERWVGMGAFITIQRLEAEDIPYTVVAVPRVMQDYEYAKRKLLPLIGDKDKFDEGFKVFDVNRLHVLDGKQVHNR